ncbi:hypothetical protein [Sulfurovum sp.]|uniref:hypothetical protein n=1 Tax=Sulfurovum sp. TaxID=1969726 RepID=UPI002867EF4F|nr:hypothetical protein [Sulfurovum sp.]
MKFLVTKELEQNRLLTLQILLLTGILTLFLFSDIVLHHYQVGLTPVQALETILGNEEAFLEPILLPALLERIHIDIFISMITLLLLVIIYIRISKNGKNKMIHLAFLSAILAPFSLLLGYFYGEMFVYVWLVMFVLWHLCALYFSLFIFRKLL